MVSVSQSIVSMYKAQTMSRVWQAELTFVHNLLLLISLIRIVDISNWNCWYQ